MRTPDLKFSLLLLFVETAFCGKGCIELDSYNFDKVHSYLSDAITSWGWPNHHEIDGKKQYLLDLIKLAQKGYSWLLDEIVGTLEIVDNREKSVSIEIISDVDGLVTQCSRLTLFKQKTRTTAMVLNKFDAALIKFDNAYPYGPEHEAFEDVCESAAPVHELLVAEVQVKDYGDKENMWLAHKYGAKKKHYPALKIFIKGQETPINYDKTVHGDVNPKNVKKFIKSNTGIHVSQPGCIRAFDVIVLKFIKASDIEEKKELLKSAEELLDEHKEKRAADVYVKLMRKMIEKGDSFVKSEMTRVEKILKEKLTKDKQAEMTERINILESFRHDEL